MSSFLTSWNGFYDSVKYTFSGRLKGIQTYDDFLKVVENTSDANAWEKNNLTYTSDVAPGDNWLPPEETFKRKKDDCEGWARLQYRALKKKVGGEMFCMYDEIEGHCVYRVGSETNGNWGRIAHGTTDRLEQAKYYYPNPLFYSIVQEDEKGKLVFGESGEFGFDKNINQETKQGFDEAMKSLKSSSSPVNNAIYQFFKMPIFYEAISEFAHNVYRENGELKILVRLAEKMEESPIVEEGLRELSIFYHRSSDVQDVVETGISRMLNIEKKEVKKLIEDFVVEFT